MNANALVGLSDWLVGILSLGFSHYFSRHLSSQYHRLWFVYFLLSATGCLIAGTYHLFVPHYIVSPYSDWLWLASIVIMGCVALAGFRMLLYYWAPHLHSKYVLYFGVLVYLIYVLFIYRHQAFAYASIFLGIMVIGQIVTGAYFCFKTHEFAWFIYVFAWLVYVFAAVIQYLELSIPALWLNYNTLYHLLAAVSWSMLFYAVKHGA